MADLNFQIVAINSDVVAKAYYDVAIRCEHNEMAFDEVMKVMEETEREHFAKMKGRYILTRATIESLTQRNGAGAIREAHGDSFAFGSRVEQAHYLTKAPRDVENSQVEKGTSGKGRSAVLVFPELAKTRIADALADFIVEPF